jgi:GT2 family glycosyltransferase
MHTISEQTENNTKSIPTVAVVILNWNGVYFLKQFLPTVLEFSQNAQVYVVDNASTDESILYLQEFASEVKIIQNPTNEGFCRGYNLALAKITSDYFILLNSDVEVTPNWIPPVIHWMETNPAIAICQPKIKAFANKDYFEYAGAAGGFLDKHGYPFCRGRVFDTLEKDVQQFEEKTQITWASGACFFIKSHVWNELGGFDEDFFAHMEEIDLCWRAKNMAYQVYFVPESSVNHVGGGTLQKSNSFKTFLNFRNGLFILHKNLPSQNLFKVIFIRLVLDGVAVVKFLLSGDFANIIAIIKAHFAYYAQIKKLNLKRKPLNINVLQDYSIVWKYFVQKKTHFSEM